MEVEQVKEPLAMSFRILPYPKGFLALAAAENGLSALALGKGKSGLLPHLKSQFRGREVFLKEGGSGRENSADEILERAAAELQAYFGGKPLGQDVPLDPPFGTPFQRAVWEKTRGIPHGQTVSYAALAERLGSRSLARAVGGALSANPIPLFVPCHRVLATDGSLGGFACGTGLKQWLLELESRSASSTRRTCT